MGKLPGSKREGISRRVLLVFLVIVTLAATQLAWWITFQIIHTGEALEARVTRLEEQARIATELIRSRARAEGFSLDLPARMLADLSPDLIWDAEGEVSEALSPFTDRGRVIVDPAFITAISDERQRRIRMFISEGLVFLAVLLLGVLIIYRTLQREVRLKRQQANFLAAVTHELKSPLASIRLLTETLSRLDLPPEKTDEYHHSILLDVDRLSGLVNNILSVARIETGREAPPTERIDLVREVETTATSLREAFQERGLHLELDLPKEEVVVRGNPEAMQTVTRNLLENAAKYGGRRKPIAVRVSSQGERALLEVEDQGIGMARQECERVFEKFYRVGNELVRQVPGSGLGLYLVKALVEEHCGSVAAHSEGPGKGTTFRVALPLDRGGSA